MVAEAITEPTELQSVVEALSMIDEGLSTVQHRELVSSDEVADLLLDLRMLLAPLTTADLGPLGDLGDEVPIGAN